MPTKTSSELIQDQNNRDATALEAVLEVLLPLPRESQQRILDTLAIFLEIRVNQ